MINNIFLGQGAFPINLIQGPLAGVSCAPFRRLTWEHSRPAFSCTEMISCKTLIYQSESSLRRFVKIDPVEGPVCFQLSGNDPQELAIATQKATGYGASLIDLNCGCPVKKIRDKGAGSRLLIDPLRLFTLITTMKQHTHLPVSIKIRVEGDGDEKCNQEIAKVVSEAGADFLVVHGRHWTEHYETPCRYDQIQFFVEQLKIPVIGNGDVACLRSLKNMFSTGCAGVMIGRAGVGQPWLIRQLMAEWREEIFLMPSLQEISAMFVSHVHGLAELLGNDQVAILQARKFAKYYARSLPNKNDFCAAINVCETLDRLESICRGFFAL